MTTPQHTEVGQQLASHLPTAETQKTAQRQHQQERLVRLFRHAGDNPDARYLYALVARYREAPSP